eukprot:gb/GECG01001042.1/.p1 GENE.gb/GECG01001042.1/~~gb/GECG01001042.1/.p1  ORF type:complete len:679 (+),score=40.93 gb/GECG01001042.1/:1-2037(+)
MHRSGSGGDGYHPFLDESSGQRNQFVEDVDDVAIASRPHPDSMETWQFPGWGTVTYKDYNESGIELNGAEGPHGQSFSSSGSDMQLKESAVGQTKLGQWTSTAISGNDITSSCLYVSGLCAAAAGRLAPIALLIVGIMLYLFRAIYGEVGTALPVNGGAYNVLLNSTTKGVASLAACLTLLSYIATGVVSGSDACVYLSGIWDSLSIEAATIAVLFIFAGLVLWGVGESAGVALTIFTMHMLTLSALIIASFVHLFRNGPQILHENWMNEPAPPALTSASSVTWVSALFFGTSSAMLGLSGFETSANFIEEQKEGVFPKTLRNMWIAVIILNPLLSFLSMANIKLEEIYHHQEDLLSHLAYVVGGNAFKIIISLDAFIVLSGAVLTSYVVSLKKTNEAEAITLSDILKSQGVCGLARRMAMDRCLPAFLLKQNRFRKTNHYIIIGFFLVASSLYLLLGGNVTTLSGVYTVSFLSVMTLFAVGCMLLKWKRPDLPRTITASWSKTAIAMFLVVAGLVGNVLRNPKMVQYFVLYFGCTLLIVAVMFYRTFLLKVVLTAIGGGLNSRKGGTCRAKLSDVVTSQVRKINKEACIFFAKHDDLPTLNKAILYVRDNEQTGRLIIIHVIEENRLEPTQLKEHVQFLDLVYPKLRIDLLLVQGRFSPQLIAKLCVDLGIPKNMVR